MTTNTKTLHHFNIVFHIETPFSTASSQPSRFGMDTPLLRNHRNQICFPGTLVQGRLLEEIYNWGNAFEVLKPLLGAPPVKGTYKAMRKQLVFTDFVLKDTLPTQTQVRIQINDATGAVEKGQIQVIEQAAKSGKPLEFTGSASVFINESEAKNVVKLLTGALKLIPSLGADHTVGFGAITSVTVESREHEFTVQPWPENATAAALHLRFDRPFLVSETSVKENLFNGSAIVPGNVLKGAFVDTCLAMGEELPDDETLSLIVFRHAFCASKDTRPCARPASLIEFKRNNIGVALDLATYSSAVVLGKGENLSAPKFSVDWKASPKTPTNYTELDDHFGWAETTTELRVRTAIDSTTRTAEDNKLFAYTQVLHERYDAPNKEAAHFLKWHTVVDITGVAEDKRNVVSTLIADVFSHGLIGLGKTKAKVHATAINPYRATADLRDSGMVYLTLQTPALLTAQTSEVGTLLGAYKATFKELSDGALTLSHFYATQTLRGGKYQKARFKQTDKYKPWLLTEAGAVFALNIVNVEKAKKLLEKWLSTGLPIPSSWGAQYSHWDTNPYQPANGFGEIAVNYDEHSSWEPDAQGVTVATLTGDTK